MLRPRNSLPSLNPRRRRRGPPPRPRTARASRRTGRCSTPRRWPAASPRPCASRASARPGLRRGTPLPTRRIWRRAPPNVCARRARQNRRKKDRCKKAKDGQVASVVSDSAHTHTLACARAQASKRERRITYSCRTTLGYASEIAVNSSSPHGQQLELMKSTKTSQSYARSCASSNSSQTRPCTALQCCKHKRGDKEHQETRKGTLSASSRARVVCAPKNLTKTQWLRTFSWCSLLQ